MRAVAATFQVVIDATADIPAKLSLRIAAPARWRRRRPPLASCRHWRPTSCTDPARAARLSALGRSQERFVRRWPQRSPRTLWARSNRPARSARRATADIPPCSRVVKAGLRSPMPSPCRCRPRLFRRWATAARSRGVLATWHKTTPHLHPSGHFLLTTRTGLVWPLGSAASSRPPA